MLNGLTISDTILSNEFSPLLILFHPLSLSFMLLILFHIIFVFCCVGPVTRG